MFGLLFRLFFWWWPKIPPAIRYIICLAFGGTVIVAWVFEPAAWPAWVVLLLIVGAMALFGDPPDSQKRGYNF